MNELSISGNKFSITEQGIEFTGELSRKEWDDLGVKLARVGKSIGFMIGDWINHGEKNWGDLYRDAMELTGLDYYTLAHYAYTAKRVQFCLRQQNLDFSHHAVVAKIKTPEEQKKWLDLAVEHNMSVRRLRKSLNFGRVATLEELEEDPADKSQMTYMAFILRICQWWRKLIDRDPVEGWDEDRKAKLKRDLGLVVEIYNQL